MNLKEYNLINIEETRALARSLSDRLKKMPKQIVFLEGDLGVGKTTLVQLILKELGITENVKSPTYTLIEPYQTPLGQKIYHIDLYRLRDINELEHLGLNDLLTEPALIFVEWPEKLTAYKIKPDLKIKLSLNPQGERSAIVQG